jgi:pyruvate/2-oxoglutarate/acetoin dehydrogenase E1 component
LRAKRGAAAGFYVQDEELSRDQTVYIMGEEVGDYQG